MEIVGDTPMMLFAIFAIGIQALPLLAIGLGGLWLVLRVARHALRG